LIFTLTTMQTPPMIQSSAVAYGLATLSKDGVILDTWYPAPQLAEGIQEAGSQVLSEADVKTHLGEAFVKALGPCELRGVNVVAVKTSIANLSEPAKDTHDVFLRLHLLSHCLIKPHQANLAGIFGMLTNLAWTSMGPCPLDQLEAARLRARAARVVFDVKAIDKFPYMTDYVVPSGVRIANVDRVRLGAHLAPGTTVMHEGFCNFNAGTLGTSMVEGRISAGVLVDDQSDVGGGASIMGTLSGGGKEVISIGKRCLLGANSGIGISLGDDCVVEAGCYVTGGTRVKMPDGSVVKARELSGRNGILFRRDSQSGAVQAIPRTESWGTLNAELHKN
jgi:2,3,4,5-tetrahydropyridine-2-carboxylate N-succinyltransferase